MFKYLLCALILCVNCFAANFDAKPDNIEKVDTWVEGVVNANNTVVTTTIGDKAEHSMSTKLVINGVKLPFASAHAKLAKEFAAKTKDSKTDADRFQIAKENAQAWEAALTTAKEEREADTTTEYKLEANSKCIFVAKRSAQDMNLIQKNDNDNPLGGYEVVSVDIYDVIDGIKLAELRVGDRIKVGFDSSTNEAQIIVRVHAAEKSETKK